MRGRTFVPTAAISVLASVLPLSLSLAPASAQRGAIQGNGGADMAMDAQGNLYSGDTSVDRITQMIASRK